MISVIAFSRGKTRDHPAHNSASTWSTRRRYICYVKESSQEERRAACRASGRAVAAALLGFTLQHISIRPLEDSPHFSGLAALAEATPSFEEQAFIDLAGRWAELDGVEFPHAPERARSKIMETFERIYPGIDAERTRHGIRSLVEDYGEAVRALARELLLRKALNGSECGKIIVSHRPRSKGHPRPQTK